MYRFDEFMADDLAMVEKIYARANLQMNPGACGTAVYIDEHPRGKHGRWIQLA